MTAGHPLGALIRGAADGVFPRVDGLVDVVPPYREGVEAVVSFTGHTVVATTLPLDELVAAGADGFGGATSPPVVALLAAGGPVGVLDAVLVARGTGGGRLPERPDLEGHQRVEHARLWRSDIRVFGDERGLVTLARGVGGLLELSFEVPPERRGNGDGRALLHDARALVPAGEPVLAAVAPGNAASLRCLLAAGFVPIGSVLLVCPGRRARPGR